MLSSSIVIIVTSGDDFQVITRADPIPVVSIANPPAPGSPEDQQNISHVHGIPFKTNKAKTHTVGTESNPLQPIMPRPP